MSLVLFEKPNPNVGVLTLNDPENLNAMSQAMADELVALRPMLANDRDLRALVITGAGRAFSAGGNLEMLKKKHELDPETNRQLMQQFYSAFLGLLDLKIPLLAAINGPAIGAGLCVACACDIRIAAQDARFGFTFVRLGLHPGMGATWFVPRVLGHAAASELLLTGRIINAEKAQGLGLVSQVVEQAELLERALAVAAEISGNGPLAIQQLVDSLRHSPQSLVLALEREALCQSVNYSSLEFLEGVSSALEKRTPKF